MAAFDFPSNPSVGDTFTPAGSDITYSWTGTVWNASVSAGSVGVTLVQSGTGIVTTPAEGITATGSVAVDSSEVLLTTTPQTKTGILTDQDGFVGPLTGEVTSGQIAVQSEADGESGSQIGSITGTTNSKLTFATTANAIGAQVVTPADQYLDIVSATDTYARFDAASQSLMIGGTIPTTAGITLAGTTVTATTFAGNATTASTLATARDITVALTGDVTGSNVASFDGSQNITITVPAVIDESAQFWQENNSIIEPATGYAGDTIYTTGDINCGGTSGAPTIKLDGSTGAVTATSFVGDGSGLTGLPRSVNFKGETDVTATAPTAVAGDFYLNTVAGDAVQSWTGINGQAVATNQFVFYTTSDEWQLGGVNDPSVYVTLSGAQTISGDKTFTSAVKVGPTDSDIRTRLYANGGVSTPLQTITGSAFDLTDGVNWTVGAVTVPNPTNAVAGMA